MASLRSVRDGLPALREVASTFLPLRGLGVVQPDGPTHVQLTYVDGLGLSVHRVRADKVPAPLRTPWSDVTRLTAAQLAVTRGTMETRILLTGMPDDVKREVGAQQVLALASPVSDRPITLIAGLSNDAPVTAEQVAKLQQLAALAAGELERNESSPLEPGLLRTIEEIEGRLPVLFRGAELSAALNVLSSLVQAVLPHDRVTLGLFSEDLTQVAVYTASSAENLPDVSDTRGPRPLLEDWICDIVDDLHTNPLEHEVAGAGMYAALRLALRLDERPFGALAFEARDAGRYSLADAAVGRRLADSLARAVQHQERPDGVRRPDRVNESATVPLGPKPVPDSATVPLLPAGAGLAPADAESAERARIEQALLDAHFNKAEAAKRLGLSRGQLYLRLRRYGFE